MTENENNFVLIKIVVQRRQGERVLGCLQKHGAPGITYYYARGAGVREKLGILARLIEAEKMVFEIVEQADKAQKLLDAVIAETNINLPGKGFCYITPVTRVEGYMAGN